MGSMVQRVRPSPDKLRQLSEHVAYEVKMLIGAATKLLGTRTTDWTDIRAQAESFLIHARQLYHFFYWPPPTRIDVSPKAKAPPIFAVDYVPAWLTMRPAASAVLDNLSKDIGRRVAHLTVERVAGQQYPVLEAARALLVVIHKFRDAKPPDFAADLGNLSPPWDVRAGLVYGAQGVVSTSSPPTGPIFIRAT